MVTGLREMTGTSEAGQDGERHGQASIARLKQVCH